MPRKIHAFVSCQRTIGLNIITFHRGLAEIVQERGSVQRAAIVTREMKRQRELVGNRRDT